MTEQPLLQTLVVGPLQVNCYLIACPVSRAALVVDPGDEGERIVAAVRAADWHVNRVLVEATGAQLLIHELDLPLLQKAQLHAQIYGLHAEPSPPPDRILRDGDRIACGELSCEVIHLPGHSPGGIALKCGRHLFVGDVLFAGSIGRTDLPGGDHQALVSGIRTRLWSLPGDTIVHPGHGPATTIAREMRSNPFVAGRID